MARPPRGLGSCLRWELVARLSQGFGFLLGPERKVSSPRSWSSCSRLERVARILRSLILCLGLEHEVHPAQVFGFPLNLERIDTFSQSFFVTLFGGVVEAFHTVIRRIYVFVEGV